MGPVIKTYGGYKPKRKGLPKYVVNGTLETTGNIFSALHINKLKGMRGGDSLKLKTQKITKTTAVREFKPIFDDSLDSTFDKIVKSSENKASGNHVLTSLSTKRHSPISNKCWTCGCIPRINMAHHVCYECKGDSFYENPSPRTVKHLKQKERQMKKAIDRDIRRRKLKLLKSPVCTSLKDNPIKMERTVMKDESRVINPSVDNSTFKTPKMKDLPLKSSTVITSTPEWCARRPKFSLQTSPILAEHTDKKAVQEFPSYVTNVPGKIQSEANDMSIVIETYCGESQVLADNFQNEMKPLKDSCKQPQILTDNFQNEMKPLKDSCKQPQILTDNFHSEMKTLKDSCKQPQILTDNFQNEMKTLKDSCNEHQVSTDDFQEERKKSPVACGETESNILTNQSCNIVESSIVGQSPFYPPHGYITKRRMWRKTRRATINVSVDMFESTNKSTFDLQSSNGHESSKIDKLQVVTSRRNHFHSRKEQTFAQQHYSVSCDGEDDSAVKLIKTESSCEQSLANESNIECVNNGSICERSYRKEKGLEDSDVNELSKNLMVHLTLLPSEDVKQKLVQSKNESDIDMFSGMSEQISNSRNKSCSVFEEQTCISQFAKEKDPVISQLLEEHSVESFHSTKDISSYVNESAIDLSSSSVIDESTDKSLDVVLKPCYVKLRRCEQAITDVMYTSKCNTAVIDDSVNDTREDLEEVLSRCGQTEPLTFSTCYPESMLSKCRKIGEGAYGEVFLYNGEKQKTVIKIIPIEGDIEINAAIQKKCWEIKPEVIVAQELSSLRNSKTGNNFCNIFNEVFAVRCVRGKYPQWMLDLWHAYDDLQGSENDCPDVFGDDQLFIILELAHGGQDLESFEFISADQAVAAISQITFALAVGESEIQFEHRDLHWGNVLIAPSKAKTVHFTLDGNKFKVPTKGVKVSVIDFTMSRMTMPSTGEAMYYDFGHDEELFAAQGDYQCDIYRLMRERTRNDWSVYEPFTNVLWLHYLLDKMCSMATYRNRNTKIHKQAMSKLENMRDTVLAYASVTAFSSSAFFKSSKIS